MNLNTYDLPEYIMQSRPAGGATVYLIRHGDTLFNEKEDERLRGWADVTLDEKGQRHAHTAAQFLMDKGIKDLFSSDLLRASQTADIIGSALNIRPKMDFNLRPWDVGVLAGEPIPDVIPKMKYYTEEAPDVPVKGGERYQDFYNRARNAIYTYVLRAQRYNYPIAAVTHSRILFTLDHILSKGKSPYRYNGEPKPGGIVKLTLGDQITSQIVHQPNG